MKRTLSVFALILMLLVGICTPALADVIVEPSGNLFYETHRDECDYVNRVFLVNGQEGNAPVYAAPDSFVALEYIGNGTRLQVSHVWTDKSGDRWGTGWNIDGWIRLSDLALIYSSPEFTADHADELADYDGSADRLAQACLYSYPGGVYSGLLEVDMESDYLPGYTYLYTDEDGLRWTYVGYYFGHRNAWLCIDDPQNEELGMSQALTVDEVRSGAQRVPASDKLPASDLLWLIPVALIVVAAVVTALIIRRRRKRSAAE